MRHAIIPWSQDKLDIVGQKVGHGTKDAIHILWYD